MQKWLGLNAFNLLRISIGLIYVWFGALKFYPGLSPADQLAKDTISLITFGLIPSDIAIKILALWETVMGILLMAGGWKKQIYILLIVHMICTFVPLFFFEAISFTQSPYAFTLVGQYIMKNLVIISAAILLMEHRAGRILIKSN